MKLIIRLDEWLLDRFERFSHWTQRTVGLTSATWERWSALLAVLDFVRVRSAQGQWSGLAILVVFFLFLRFLRSFWHHTTTAAEPTMNPLKLNDRASRVFLFLTCLIILPFDLLPPRAVWFELQVISAYFAACDDLPPGESKLKALIRTLRSSRQSDPVRV